MAVPRRDETTRAHGPLRTLGSPGHGVLASSVVRQIGSLFDGGSVAGLSDRQLIERFTARRDPPARRPSPHSVTRHGPMVLGVCRQLLGDRHHAEDAFQAVFLVLARKAGRSATPTCWATGSTAWPSARRGRPRLRLARRRKSRGRPLDEASGSGSSTVPAEQPVLAREQAEALHDEIDRLPGAFRLPVVLCYFEGLTLRRGGATARMARTARSAAGWPGRATSSAAASPAAAWSCPPPPWPRSLDSRPASASVSSPLCDITTRAAMNFAAGQAAAAHSAGGPCPGGAEIHADAQAEIHRDDPAVPLPPSPPARGI